MKGRVLLSVMAVSLLLGGCAAKEWSWSGSWGGFHAAVEAGVGYDKLAGQWKPQEWTVGPSASWGYGGSANSGGTGTRSGPIGSGTHEKVGRR